MLGFAVSVWVDAWPLRHPQPQFCPYSGNNALLLDSQDHNPFFMYQMGVGDSLYYEQLDCGPSWSQKLLVLEGSIWLLAATKTRLIDFLLPSGVRKFTVQPGWLAIKLLMMETEGNVECKGGRERVL